MRRGRARGAAAVLLIAAASLSSCADHSELSFRQDDRLQFTAPTPYELVDEPVTLAWTMDDFDVVAPGSGAPASTAGYFAVFVDRAPVRPGGTLDDVAGRDQACRRDPQCPDHRYLADRGVYTTTATTFEVPVVRDLNSREQVQLHEVTVVLLDSAGSRIGETAWHIPFKLERTVG